LDDVLAEASPDLEDEPEAVIAALRMVLRPLVNEIIRACRTPERLPAVVARMSEKAKITPATAQALALFVANMHDAEKTGYTLH
ncbi:hypothetical protein, partial [Streptomyces cyaneofuscatus]|uniref:hypothetical protein n=1 Tax=Streptomyces cyaneofuscatus TaxID=66883 RepID=UPI002FEF9A83